MTQTSPLRPDTLQSAPRQPDPDSIGLDAREAFLRDLMPRAAALAREGFERRTAGSFELKGPQDFLTETDLAVEKLIREAITAAFPADAILGEEGGGQPGASTWVIDPIDGTANFARGLPHFCVIVSFCQDGICVLGAMEQPVLGESYFARRGQGATLNGAPMHVSGTAELASGCVEMGWSRRHPVTQYLAAQEYVLTQGANIRRGGSGGMALAHVAQGCSDGYLELSMNSWDCLAGLLMVEEAGGVVGTWPDGLDDLTRIGPVLAATPALAGALAGVGYAGLALKPRG